jgi:hypothetical protein
MEDIKNKILSNLKAFDNRIEWLLSAKKGNFDFEVVEVEFEKVWVKCSRTYIAGGSYYEKEELILAPKPYIKMFEVLKFDNYFFDYLIHEESKEDLIKVFIDQLDGRKIFYLKGSNYGSGWHVA